MKIHQIYTHNELRNFTYLIELANQSAIVVDPWDAIELNKILESKKLSLRAIINTHEHWDHTQGNSALVEKHGCEVWAHENGEGKIPGLTRKLKAFETVILNEEIELVILDTPGHTFAHLCFIVKQQGNEKAVFTGDTLFNAGVGHCRSGNEEVLYQTITEHFQSLDNSILVYPGHDYLENNLKFTLAFEPNNLQAKAWLEKVASSSYVPGSIQTTIGNEKDFNTFMRLDSQEIARNLNLVNATEKQIFLALRARRDKW